MSVVVPCYDYAHFLPEALDSALRQTLAPVQVLVVDDGSSDDTAAVAARYAPRVEYVHQANAGLSAARNTGARHVRGDLVVFLDADDVLEDRYLEACAVALAAAPPEVAFAYTPMRLFGRQDGVIRCPPFAVRTLRYGNYVNASAMLRTEVVRRFPYREGLRALEDFDLYLTLAEHGLRGVRVDEPLLRYRKHASMTDAQAARWDEIFDEIAARHPTLYPRHVRLGLRLQRALDSRPLLSRAAWRARGLVREAAGRRAAVPAAAPPVAASRP